MGHRSHLMHPIRSEFASSIAAKRCLNMSRSVPPCLPSPKAEEDGRVRCRPGIGQTCRIIGSPYGGRSHRPAHPPIRRYGGREPKGRLIVCSHDGHSYPRARQPDSVGALAHRRCDLRRFCLSKLPRVARSASHHLKAKSQLTRPACSACSPDAARTSRSASVKPRIALDALA